MLTIGGRYSRNTDTHRHYANQSKRPTLRERYIYENPGIFGKISCNVSFNQYRKQILNSYTYDGVNLSFTKDEVETIDLEYIGANSSPDFYYKTGFIQIKGRKYLVFGSTDRDGIVHYQLNKYYKQYHEDLLGKGEIKLITSRIYMYICKRFDIYRNRNIEESIHNFLVDEAIQGRYYSDILGQIEKDDWHWNSIINEHFDDKILPLIKDELLKEGIKNITL